MESLRLLATLLPLSLTSGLNLYATVLVVGISIRLGWVQHPPSGLEAFAAWPVIIIAGVVYVIEFLADKIQFVDNVWDVIHTFIRPLGAAALGLAVLSGTNPVLAIAGALLAGGIALFSHGGKASARVAINVASPAENLSNIAISLAEDATAGLLAFLSLKYPYLAAGLALFLIGLILLIVPLLLRWVWFTLTALFNWVKSLGRKVMRREAPPDGLPPEHLALLGHAAPQIAARCKAQNIRGGNGYTGFAATTGDALVFTFDKWRKSQLWQVKLAQVRGVYIRNRPLLDVMEVHYQERDKPHVARFVFLKDRGALAERLAVAVQHGMN
jgi:hypothetical protein